MCRNVRAAFLHSDLFPFPQLENLGICSSSSVKSSSIPPLFKLAARTYFTKAASKPFSARRKQTSEACFHLWEAEPDGSKRDGSACEPVEPPPPPQPNVPTESSCFRRQTNRTCTVHVRRCEGRQGSGTDLMGVDA